MSNLSRDWRCFKNITLHDLKNLALIIKKDRDNFFSTHPAWRALYKDRFICSALCQGAALHYINKHIGVNDFDLYNFFADNPKKRWYAKRHKKYDFGDAKFGQSKDKPDYIGRRVDVFGRAIRKESSDDISTALQHYLINGKTKTARLLSENAVVLLEPIERIGEVVWPINDVNRKADNRLLSKKGE